MAKEILTLLEKVGDDLAELCLPSADFTLNMMIYTSSPGVTRTGHLRFKLDDVLAAVTMINKRLNKVNKLEKRVKLLEKKLKK